MSNIPVALVTGGSRGIGRAAAEELAREGYKVALIARTPERLEAAARELVETLGLDAEHAPVTFALDVGDGQAVGDAVDRLAAEWGRIDVLFNSAGVSIPGTLCNTYKVDLARPREPTDRAFLRLRQQIIDESELVL